MNNFETGLQETLECEVDVDSVTLQNKRRKSCNPVRPASRSKDMKKHIAEGKFLTDFNEALCVQCRRPFQKGRKVLNECIFHLKPWNGFDFECCGNKNKFNLGCKTGFHLTEDEEKLRKALEICTNCKGQGHDSKKCPLDPNARSGEDPIQELTRITRLGTAKTSQKFHSLRKYKIKEDSFADITLLKNSVVKEKKYLERPFNQLAWVDVDETKDSSLALFKKIRNFKD
jgi:hypothetical protein